MSQLAAAVDNFGDSSAYMTLASAIRRFNFGGLVVQQFWGLPYAMAALSTVTRISDRTALLTISVVASLIAVALTWELWDGWIAGLFAVLNLDWLQRSYLGGSEPLFVALLFGSFLAVRKERWLLAALLASLATVVRPLGISHCLESEWHCSSVATGARCSRRLSSARWWEDSTSFRWPGISAIPSPT